MDGPPGSPDMPQLMDADDLSRRGPSPAATQSAIVDSTTRPDPQRTSVSLLSRLLLGVRASHVARQVVDDSERTVPARMPPELELTFLFASTAPAPPPAH